MDFRQIRYFLTIAKCGSFSRAANELNVAQPALSHHVANLEAELNVRLFDRSTKGVVPTECGETLIGHAETILHQIEQAARDVRNQSANPSGVVSIGVPSSVSLGLTIPLLVEVERRFPEIELKISENHSGYLVDWLTTGRLDLAILFDVDDDLPFKNVALFQEALYLVGSIDQMPSVGAEIDFSEAMSKPLVLTGESHGLWHVIDRYSKTGATPVKIKVELDSLVAIKKLVANGYAHSVLPWYAIREEVQADQLAALKITNPSIERAVSLSRSAEWAPTRATEQLSSLVTELVKGLVVTDNWLGIRPDA